MVLFTCIKEHFLPRMAPVQRLHLLHKAHFEKGHHVEYSFPPCNSQRKGFTAQPFSYSQIDDFVHQVVAQTDQKETS